VFGISLCDLPCSTGVAGGVYLCEDTHTSYWPDFGGGLRKEGTFIERTKGLIDSIHAWRLSANVRTMLREGMLLAQGLRLLVRGGVAPLSVAGTQGATITEMNRDVDKYTKSIQSFHIYESMVFIEKGPVEPPSVVRAGEDWIPYDPSGKVRQ
jgi:hypothetical protein